MRTPTLGRWVGHLVAVTALGMGVTVGTSVAGSLDEINSSGAHVSQVASSETAPDDTSTDSFEWN